MRTTVSFLPDQRTLAVVLDTVRVDDSGGDERTPGPVVDAGLGGRRHIANIRCHVPRLHQKMIPLPLREMHAIHRVTPRMAMLAGGARGATGTH